MDIKKSMKKLLPISIGAVATTSLFGFVIYSVNQDLKQRETLSVDTSLKSFWEGPSVAAGNDIMADPDIVDKITNTFIQGGTPAPSSELTQFGGSDIAAVGADTDGNILIGGQGGAFARLDHNGNQIGNVWNPMTTGITTISTTFNGNTLVAGDNGNGALISGISTTPIKIFPAGNLILSSTVTDSGSFIVAGTGGKMQEISANGVLIGDPVIAWPGRIIYEIINAGNGEYLIGGQGGSVQLVDGNGNGASSAWPSYRIVLNGGTINAMVSDGQGGFILGGENGNITRMTRGGSTVWSKVVNSGREITGLSLNGHGAVISVSAGITLDITNLDQANGQRPKYFIQPIKISSDPNHASHAIQGITPDGYGGFITAGERGIYRRINAYGQKVANTNVIIDKKWRDALYDDGTPTTAGYKNLLVNGVPDGKQILRGTNPIGENATAMIQVTKPTNGSTTPDRYFLIGGINGAIDFVKSDGSPYNVSWTEPLAAYANPSKGGRTYAINGFSQVDENTVLVYGAGGYVDELKIYWQSYNNPLGYSRPSFPQFVWTASDTFNIEGITKLPRSSRFSTYQLEYLVYGEVDGTSAFGSVTRGFINPSTIWSGFPSSNKIIALLPNSTNGYFSLSANGYINKFILDAGRYIRDVSYPSTRIGAAGVVFNDAILSPEGNLVAVGNNGKFVVSDNPLEYSPTFREYSTTTLNFRSVINSGDGAFIVGGQNSTVRKYDAFGNHITPQPFNPFIADNQINAFQTDGQGGIYALGNIGRIAHFNPKTFAKYNESKDASMSRWEDLSKVAISSVVAESAAMSFTGISGFGGTIDSSSMVALPFYLKYKYKRAGELWSDDIPEDLVNNEVIHYKVENKFPDQFVVGTINEYTVTVSGLSIPISFKPDLFSYNDLGVVGFDGSGTYEAKLENYPSDRANFDYEFLVKSVSWLASDGTPEWVTQPTPPTNLVNGDRIKVKITTKPGHEFIPGLSVSVGELETEYVVTNLVVRVPVDLGDSNNIDLTYTGKSGFAYASYQGDYINSLPSSVVMQYALQRDGGPEPIDTSYRNSQVKETNLMNGDKIWVRIISTDDSKFEATGTSIISFTVNTQLLALDSPTLPSLDIIGYEGEGIVDVSTLLSLATFPPNSVKFMYKINQGTWSDTLPSMLSNGTRLEYKIVITNSNIWSIVEKPQVQNVSGLQSLITEEHELPTLADMNFSGAEGKTRFTFPEAPATSNYITFVEFQAKDSTEWIVLYSPVSNLKNGDKIRVTFLPKEGYVFEDEINPQKEFLVENRPPEIHIDLSIKENISIGTSGTSGNINIYFEGNYIDGSIPTPGIELRFALQDTNSPAPGSGKSDFPYASPPTLTNRQNGDILWVKAFLTDPSGTIITGVYLISFLVDVDIVVIQTPALSNLELKGTNGAATIDTAKIPVAPDKTQWEFKFGNSNWNADSSVVNSLRNNGTFSYRLVVKPEFALGHRLSRDANFTQVVSGLNELISLAPNYPTFPNGFGLLGVNGKARFTFPRADGSADYIFNISYSSDDGDSFQRILVARNNVKNSDIIRIEVLPRPGFQFADFLSGTLSRDFRISTLDEETFIKLGDEINFDISFSAGAPTYTGAYLATPPAKTKIYYYLQRAGAALPTDSDYSLTKPEPTDMVTGDSIWVTARPDVGSNIVVIGTSVIQFEYFVSITPVDSPELTELTFTGFAGNVAVEQSSLPPLDSSLEWEYRLLSADDNILVDWSTTFPTDIENWQKLSYRPTVKDSQTHVLSSSPQYIQIVTGLINIITEQLIMPDPLKVVESGFNGTGVVNVWDTQPAPITYYYKSEISSDDGVTWVTTLLPTSTATNGDIIRVVAIPTLGYEFASTVRNTELEFRYTVAKLKSFIVSDLSSLSNLSINFIGASGTGAISAQGGYIGQPPVGMKLTYSLTRASNGDTTVSQVADDPSDIKNLKNGDRIMVRAVSFDDTRYVISGQTELSITVTGLQADDFAELSFTREEVNTIFNKSGKLDINLAAYKSFFEKINNYIETGHILEFAIGDDSTYRAFPNDFNEIKNGEKLFIRIRDTSGSAVQWSLNDGEGYTMTFATAAAEPDDSSSTTIIIIASAVGVPVLLLMGVSVWFFLRRR